MSDIQLKFGHSDLIPADTAGAWGCRAIVSQTGHVDTVYDRQDAIGDTARVCQTLDRTFSLPRIREAIRDLLLDGAMQTRAAQDFVLYEDDTFVVHANTRASFGYCYVTAWLKAVAA